PGAPDLITVRGLRALRSADVVVYDRLVHPDLLAEARPGAQLIYAGKAPGRHAKSQDEINKLLYDLASQGLAVARLHGGDPLLYGRGEEECAYLLSRGVECEVVPGVPSFVGAAAEHLIPLAGRGVASEVVVSTGTYAGGSRVSEDRAKSLIELAGNAVFLMATKSYTTILRAALHAKGRDVAVAVVERATMGSRLVIDTASRLLEADYRPEPPSVIIVGGGPEWRMRLGVKGASRS
ncbi:MAG: uroporphyrinogen-III C-methyltransferase, partial [Desulfurococcales archaeon]|nr:uroporphyrinogen-III C-methyltransferase [Desulfurococcales archaeon]